MEVGIGGLQGNSSIRATLLTVRNPTAAGYHTRACGRFQICQISDMPVVRPSEQREKTSMRGKAIPLARSKRALHMAGTPIFDAVVAELGFDPSAGFTESVKATPKTVAKRVRKKTPVAA